MKTIKLLLAISLLTLATISGFSQTVETIMETNWTGYSSSRAEITESGYVVVYEELYNVNYDDSDGSFTAIAKSVFNYDGEDYTLKVYISGSVDPENATIQMRQGSVISQDYLPDGMYWLSGITISMSIYEDEDHPGYYIMSGKTSNQIYDDEFYALTNYPY